MSDDELREQAATIRAAMRGEAEGQTDGGRATAAEFFERLEAAAERRGADTTHLGRMTRELNAAERAVQYAGGMEAKNRARDALNAQNYREQRASAVDAFGRPVGPQIPDRLLRPPEDGAILNARARFRPGANPTTGYDPDPGPDPHEATDAMMLDITESAWWLYTSLWMLCEYDMRFANALRSVEDRDELEAINAGHESLIGGTFAQISHTLGIAADRGNLDGVAMLFVTDLAHTVGLHVDDGGADPATHAMSEAFNGMVADWKLRKNTREPMAAHKAAAYIAEGNSHQVASWVNRMRTRTDAIALVLGIALACVRAVMMMGRSDLEGRICQAARLHNWPDPSAAPMLPGEDDELGDRMRSHAADRYNAWAERDGTTRAEGFWTPFGDDDMGDTIAVTTQNASYTLTLGVHGDDQPAVKYDHQPDPGGRPAQSPEGAAALMPQPCPWWHPFPPDRIWTWRRRLLDLYLDPEYRDNIRHDINRGRWTILPCTPEGLAVEDVHDAECDAEYERLLHGRWLHADTEQVLLALRKARRGNLPPLTWNRVPDKVHGAVVWLDYPLTFGPDKDPVVGISWQVQPADSLYMVRDADGRSGVQAGPGHRMIHIRYYTASNAEQAAALGHQGPLFPRWEYESLTQVALPDADPLPVEMKYATSEWELAQHFIFALWLLMTQEEATGQPVMDTGRQEQRPKERRRDARAGIATEASRAVHLIRVTTRRKYAPSYRTRSTTGRTMQYREWVREHDKRECPNKHKHREIVESGRICVHEDKTILEYQRGPEGAPWKHEVAAYDLKIRRDLEENTRRG